MVGSRGWLAPLGSRSAPLEGLRIELIQIVKVVLAIATAEYVDLIVIAVSSVHIAGARWDPLGRELYPSIHLEIQNMHVISG